MKEGKRQVFVFETENGQGEAIKLAKGEPWCVSAPCGDLRFYGSKASLKRRVREFVDGPVVWL